MLGLTLSFDALMRAPGGRSELCFSWAAAAEPPTQILEIVPPDEEDEPLISQTQHSSGHIHSQVIRGYQVTDEFTLTAGRECEIIVELLTVADVVGSYFGHVNDNRGGPRLNGRPPQSPRSQLQREDPINQVSSQRREAHMV